MTKQAKQPRSKRLMLVSFIGGIFYLLCLFQWLWSLVPFLPSIIDTLNQTNQHTEQSSTPTPSLISIGEVPTSVSLTIGIIFIILATAATIYAIITLPSNAGKVGNKVARSTVRHIAPLTPHYEKLSEKKRLLLSARLMFYVKLSLLTAPPVITLLSWNAVIQLDYAIMVIVATILAFASAMTLLTQILVAKWCNVSIEKIL